MEQIGVERNHSTRVAQSPEAVKAWARECGFELAGVCAAQPILDSITYEDWTARGLAGKMSYLSDHRAQVRRDPRNLLPSARSIICVGKLYNGPQAYSTSHTETELGWISRYAWGPDYHRVLRIGLERLANRLGGRSRICVDTAPLLERSYARLAGLGWIGHNTCLINQMHGSWFFLGELLTEHEFTPDAPPPNRCGTCRRCIDACPTQALIPRKEGWELDARLCISYLTIELRGVVPEQHRAGTGRNVFGCDICQDVCPWNRRAAVTDEFSPLAPFLEAPPLERLAEVTESEFRELFRRTPVERARYSGFLRNVATAMGNTRLVRFRPALERMASSDDAAVADHARWALAQLME